MFGSDQERLARFERKADLFEDAQFQVKEGLKMNIHSRIGSLICVALIATALSLACATPPPQLLRSNPQRRQFRHRLLSRRKEPKAGCRPAVVKTARSDLGNRQTK